EHEVDPLVALPLTHTLSLGRGRGGQPSCRARWAALFARFWHRVEQNLRPPLREVSSWTRSHRSAAQTPSRPASVVPRAIARPGVRRFTSTTVVSSRLAT